MSNKQSKMEKLISELCPNGVEYEELGEVLKRTKGTPITAGQMSELNKDGAPIKVFAGGKTVAHVDYGDIPDKNVLTKESIVVKSRGIIAFEYVNQPFSHKNEFWSYYSNKPNINIKYVYYYLKNAEFYFQTVGGKMSKMPQLSIPDTDNFKIPIPPIEVQEEIVKILNSFTELETEIEVELKAELKARKEQHEYYQDKLFKFNDEVSWTTLNKVADIGTGGSNTNEGLEEGMYPFFVRSQIVRYKNSYEFDETAIITSGDGVGVGKIFHFVEGKYALHQRAYRFHITDNRLNPKFLFFYIKNTFGKYILGSVVHSSVTSVRRPMLEKYPIPIPSPEEQERIIAILDKFDAMVNEISICLPAELSARRSQYEYYRNKLLTFNEYVQ